jgi:hypothetical protein
MRNTKLLANALALAAIGLGVAACHPGTAPSAGQKLTDPNGTAAPTAATAASGGGSAMGSASGAGFSTGPGSYILQPMPAGTVWVDRGLHGRLQVRVHVFGLTPGSAHQVSIDGPLGHPVRFPALTADASGQADTTLTSVDHAGWLRPLSRFVIRLGNSGGDPMAAEPIAESAVLSPRPGAWSPLQAVSAGGARPAGRTTITYNAAAHTLTVTLTASGLNPGPHAAHIHLGSCRNQGGVKYMMADFTADAGGAIANQTRVITGVTSVPGPGNWYLNLHQGGMNQILAGGVPTLSFRPMLCADLTSFAAQPTAGGATADQKTSPAPPMTTPAAPSMTTPAATPSTTAPAVTPSTAPTATPSTTMPGGTPTPVSSPGSPTALPTHY